MKLTLIRHGDTEATLRRLYYGSTDLPLLPQSAQALEANAALYPKAPRYYQRDASHGADLSDHLWRPAP